LGRAVRMGRNQHEQESNAIRADIAPPPTGEFVSSRSLLAAIVESSEDGIISKDLYGIVTSWNQSAERIFGYTAEEMIGRPIAILAAPDRLDEMPRILARIRRGERVEHYETKRQAKSGRIIDISLTVSPIRDESGRIVGASKIVRDIGERKLAEQAIAEQVERLARTNADLQEFAYATSHDLQEPLRTIASFSELLRQQYRSHFDKDADQMIDLVIGAATRMSSLIRDVLAYSRVINAEDIPFNDVSTTQMVEWAIENLQFAIKESGAIVEFEHLPVVKAEKAILAHVFQNLISNAIKYRSSAPPHIRIQSRKEGKTWVFSVADNGLGIPAAYHETIFKLFKRLHAGGYEGTGVGLALCKKIVEKHGGRIWVESEPGRGSVFQFTIPQREETNAE
jgi:PAS domain S-box-containing protein